MRSPLALLLPLLLIAPLASGADAVAEARTRVQEAQERASDLRRQQLSLSGRIGALSEEIATLKAGRSRAEASRLDAALKEHQAHSTTLGDVTRALNQNERTLTEARSLLLNELAGALVQLRSRHDRTGDRDARGRLLDQMRALRNESARVRSQLPPALMPTLPPELARGDDPEDLLAQADVLRDNADRLAQRLAELRTRLKQARAEADLSRRVDDFMGESSLFDEQDRRHPFSLSSTRVESSGNSPSPDAPPAGPSTHFNQFSTSGKGSFETSALTGRAAGPGPEAGADLGIGQLEQLEAQLTARAREYAERAAALERRARGH